MTTRFSDHLLTGPHSSLPVASAVPPGGIYSCTTHNLVYQSNGTAWSTWATLGGTATQLPTGVITMFGGGSAPTGALLCDGASYSRTTQANLFAVIGTANGFVDGTHFNVPDMRGRAPVGYAASGGHTDVATIGLTDAVALANRRPKHNHTNSVTGTPSGLTLPNHVHSVTDPQHSHTIPSVAIEAHGVATNTVQQTDQTAASTVTSNAASTGISIGNPTTLPGISGSISIAGTIGPAGTNAIDSEPYYVCNYIIWT